MNDPSNPRVSVVVPAYNVEPYVGAAIRSALGQRAVSLEVIAVDDGSTDGTRAVLQHLAAADPRLRVVFQGNQGPSGSRNAALALARGAYVGFLDADDLWEPEKAARHIELMDASPGIDISYSWWRVIDEAGRETGRRATLPARRIPGGLTLAGLLIENFTGTLSTTFCRREALSLVGGFDAGLRSNVDLDLLLRLAALRPGNVALVPEILTSYRMRSGQITKDWTRMRSNLEVVIRKAAQRAPEQVAAVQREAFARWTRYHAYVAYEAGDVAAARRLIREAWTAHPASLARDKRAWLTTAAILATHLPAKSHRVLAETVKSWRARKARA